MTIENRVKTDGNGPYLERDPRSRVPVQIDWSAWLTQEGATTIANSAWTTETGLTLDGDVHANGIAAVNVSGGAHGSTYVIRNTITCANGRIDSRSIRIAVKDR